MLRGRYEVMKWAIFQGASIGPMFGQMAYFHDYAEAEDAGGARPL